MRLLENEFRKLRGVRYFAVLLVLLFAVNLYICYRNNSPSFDPYMRAYNEASESFVELYHSDPAGYAEMRAKMEAAIEEKDRIETEKQSADPNYVRDYSGTYVYCADVEDELLLNDIDFRLEDVGNFDVQVKQILFQTEKTMRNMKRNEGLSIHDFRYAEQAYAYQTYSFLLENTAPELVYLQGWDDLFSHHYGDVLLMAVLLLLGSLLFLPEKQTGMLPILRCTKKGGAKTALAKLGTMSILSVLLTLLFTFGTMAVLQFCGGFSDWNVSVQSISEFRLFPRVYTIREYFFLYIGLKLLGALAFSAICTFLSVVFYHPLLSYGSGAVLAGISFVLYKLPLSTNTYLPQQLNLFSIITVKPLSMQLRVANFFGLPIQSVTFALLEAGLLFLGASLFTVFLHSRGNALRFAGFERAIEKLGEKGKQVARTAISILPWRKHAPAGSKQDVLSKKKREKAGRRYAHSIFGWELRKVFLGEPMLVLITLLMIAAQVFLGVTMKNDYRQSSDYRIYKQLYLPEIDGPYTGEKGDYIDRELATEQSYGQGFGLIQEAHSKGEISDQEFMEYQEAAERAKFLVPVLQDLQEKKNDYIDRIEKGKPAGHFVDSEGFETLMTSGFSLPLFASLLVICAASFAKEYGGKSKTEHFAVILRSTYLGRQDTFRKKCLACCLVGLLLGGIFYGIELGFYLSIYDFPLSALSAPLFSLDLFRSYGDSMSLLTALVLVYVMKFVALILTVLLLCAISALCKNLLQGLTLSLLGTMIPSLLVYLGLDSARCISYAEWMASGKMLHFSTEVDLLGKDLALYVLYSVAVGGITALFLFLAAKQHNGVYRSGRKPSRAAENSETSKSVER